MDRHRVVICGSMSHYDRILSCKAKLVERDIPALIPPTEEAHIGTLSGRAFLDFKRTVSRKYLNEIRSPRTDSILVVNESKRSIENYIGANTFAEIAIAFDAGKAIFLLHDFYAPYKDELCAWGAVPLKGNIDMMVEMLQKPSVVPSIPVIHQERLFHSGITDPVH